MFGPMSRPLTLARSGTRFSQGKRGLCWLLHLGHTLLVWPEAGLNWAKGIVDSWHQIEFFGFWWSETCVGLSLVVALRLSKFDYIAESQTEPVLFTHLSRGLIYTFLLVNLTCRLAVGAAQISEVRPAAITLRVRSGQSHHSGGTTDILLTSFAMLAASIFCFGKRNS